MKLLVLPIAILILATAGAASGQERYDKAFIKSEMQRLAARMQKEAAEPAGTTAIDVKYYRLDLTITTSPAYLNGSVVIDAMSTANGLASVTLDLMNAMQISSVTVGGSACAFSQGTSTFAVTLNRTYNAGEMIHMKVFYDGTPGSSGFGSFEFGSHASTPWIWSLSEPYGAKDWWPSNDHPSDKADSVDMYVTVSRAYKVGSNGKLVADVDNGNGTHTVHWHEGYPISTYLVSVAITNYAAFSNWFKYSPADSMEVLNYVLPEHLASAQSQLPEVVNELAIYSDLFGLYPFINEKYGHSEFGWGGGMEHQTMTSLGGFSAWLTAHELAHQWFGDMITTRTWPHIWLNEGFATYCELLYEERRFGFATYQAGINSDMNGAKTVTSPVYVADSESVGSLFDGNRVYNKGAVVLHMLRHALGDSVFFHAMYNYANDPRVRFGTATTEDFRTVCEETSGKSLGYFFDEWIYGTRYPHYVTGWTADSTGDGFDLAIAVNQTTGTVNPPFFTMPVDFKISGAGWDTTVTFFNDANPQTFETTLPRRPLSVTLDPGGWIMKSVDTTVAFVPTPSTINFGTVHLGDSSFRTLTVHNGGGLDLRITSIVTGNPTVSITPDTALIPPGGNQVFTVAFIPRDAGHLLAAMSFAHDAPGSPGMVYVRGDGGVDAAPYAAAWNIVAVPVGAPDFRTLTLFPGALRSAYRYTDAGTYVPADTLENGRGYWVKFGAPVQPAFTGTCIDADTIDIHPGWNLIGTVSLPVTAADISSLPPGLVTSVFFGYDQGYFQADTLRPGSGYWVKGYGSGALILASHRGGTAAGRISIMPASGTPPLPPGAGGEPAEKRLPSAFSLGQSYPNPCNPGAIIQYSLPAGSNVSLSVFNLLGERVATLVEGYQEAGYKETAFDGSNLPSGMYIYRITAGSFSATGKLVLMK